MRATPYGVPADRKRTHFRAGSVAGLAPPGVRRGGAYDDDDVNYAAILENGALIVIALAFLGLLTGGFVKDNRLRIALLLGVGAIGVVIYMLTVNGGGGEPVI